MPKYRRVILQSTGDIFMSFKVRVPNTFRYILSCAFQVKRIAQPEYTFSVLKMDKGPDEYTYYCKVEDKVTSHTSTLKKEAKEEAAKKMCDKLQLR